MGGSIFCNKEAARVPLVNCKHCRYAIRPEDWGGMTCCMYNNAKIAERTGGMDALHALEYQAAIKEEQMNRAYQRGQQRKGDELAWELGAIQKKIRKMKGAGK